MKRVRASVAEEERGDFLEDGSWDLYGTRRKGERGIPESTRWRYVDHLVGLRRSNPEMSPRAFAEMVEQSRFVGMFPFRHLWARAKNWKALPAKTSAEWTVKLSGRGSTRDAGLIGERGNISAEEVREFVDRIVRAVDSMGAQGGAAT